MVSRPYRKKESIKKLMQEEINKFENDEETEVQGHLMFT